MSEIIDQQATSGRVGRPPGSFQTPRTVLRTNLIQTLKLCQELRGLMGDLIRDVRKALREPTFPFRERLAVMESITKALLDSAKSVESVVKTIAQIDSMDRPAPVQVEVEEPEEEGSVEDIMKELQGE